MSTNTANLSFIFSAAATIFQHFVAADDSSEAFASLKRIHGLMPYFMLKAALKISNPIAMIRSQLHSSFTSFQFMTRYKAFSTYFLRSPLGGAVCFNGK